MTRLLLVPHAETDWNAAGRFQGHADTPLNERGRRQAVLLGRRLAAERISETCASDLRRAWDTARSIATPRPEPRLRELNFGDWEGLTYEQVSRAHVSALAGWQEDPLRNAPPGGETLASLGSRLRSFLDEVARSASERTLLLVSHRGALRVLLCLVLGLPLTAHWRFLLQPASLSVLDCTETGGVLSSLNDTHHLREDPDAR
jgi:broad specificity phosphatase PhoE